MSESVIVGPSVQWEHMVLPLWGCNEGERINKAHKRRRVLWGALVNITY